MTKSSVGRHVSMGFVRESLRALGEFCFGTRKGEQPSEELLLFEAARTDQFGSPQPESGVLATLYRLKDSASSALRARGLYRSQVEKLQCILEDAKRLEECVRRPIHWLRLTVVLLALAFLLGVPYALLVIYGWHDRDLEQASNLAQFLDAVASGMFLFVSAFIAAVLLDLRIRTRVAMAQIQRCRVLIQVVDSHILSNHDTMKRVLESGTVSAGANAELSRCVETEVEYLHFAGNLVRIAAKAAVLYGQWLPRDSVVREADMLSQLSISIEQGCLQRIAFLCSWQASVHPQAHNPRATSPM